MMKERLIKILNVRFDEKSRYKDFENLTGINKSTWRALCDGKQRFSEPHIEAICSAFPEYKYWFVFGETNPEQGQISPELDDVIQAYKG